MSDDTMNILKERLHGTGVRKLEKDDTFNFSCKQCGKCCTNRVGMESIIINPFDVYKIAKGLNIETSDVLNKYVEFEVGSNSRMPLLYVKNSKTVFDKEQSCIFKSGSGCGVHTYKPTACSLYPLGRLAQFEKDSTDNKPVIEYFVQDVHCPGSKPTLNNKHTVDEWLPNREAEEAYFNQFNNLMQKLEETSYRQFMDNDRISDKLKTTQLNVVAQLLYANYDMEKEFLPQFKQRCEDIIEVQNAITKMYYQFGMDAPTIEETQEVEVKNSHKHSL